MCYGKYILVIAAVISATGACATVELDNSYRDYEYDYSFDVPALRDEGYSVLVYGREVTREGQNVYLGFLFYAVHSARVEATNSRRTTCLFTSSVELSRRLTYPMTGRGRPEAERMVLMGNKYRTSKAATYLALFLATALATGARATVKLDYYPYDVDYSFWLPEVDAGYDLNVYGREVTREGQNVYLGFHFYAVHGGCAEETNSLCYDNLILLENAAGVAYEPVSVHIVEDTAVYEWARKYVKFKYVGDFAGRCTLLVKLGDGRTARLDMGPAECDFYRMGTVRAPEEIDVHVAPDYASPVLRELRPGDTVYYTGRESHFWPEVDTMWYERLDFFEVICDGARGWVPAYDEAKRLEYEKQHGEEPKDQERKGIEWDSFAPCGVPHGQAGTTGGGEDGTNGE